MSKDSPKERPTGVTILVILDIFSALLSFALIAVSPSIALLGIIYLVLAYGLWSGKGWAWSLLMFFSIASVVVPLASYALIRSFITSIASLNLIEILINAIVAVIIIYYLTRSHVKTFFGKQEYSLVDWFLGRKRKDNI